MKNILLKVSLTFLILAILMIATIIVIKNDNNPKYIEKVESDFGPVWIFEQDNKRCMSFLEPPTPIVQSCLFIKNDKRIQSNYIKPMLGILFFTDNPRNILVIGLGGASLQKTLNILLPTSQIHTVEINPVLPSLAEKYFSYKENERNKIFIIDAAKFAREEKPSQYDIILIDAFNSDYIPTQLLTDEFMQNIRKLLTKNGVVAINTFADSELSQQEADLFKKNFDKYYNLLLKTSRIMIATKDTLPEIQEISNRSIFWRYRFVEVGASQDQILQLIKSPQ
jgi:spermidine synthase